MESPRSAPKNPVLLIPARLASARLPNKILADIHGAPMIAHVIRAAKKTNLGPVIVAAGDQAIVDAAEKEGATGVFTDPALPTGSDRIYAALSKIDPDKKYDAVINVQGDEPMLDPEDVKRAYALLQNPATDIGTLVLQIKDDAKMNAPQVVKAVVDMKDGKGRASTFTRSPTPGAYHHIGIYAYRREALEAFVRAPQAEAEKRESLEQLRALAMGMRIDAALCDTLSFGIDTPDDLERARTIMAGTKK